jgi:hypothetical protein
VTFREIIFAYENEADLTQFTEKDGNNSAQRKNFSYKKQHTMTFIDRIFEYENEADVKR